MPCISNVMVVGDQKPYLNCLISLVEDPPRSGKISKSAVSFLAADYLPWIKGKCKHYELQF